MTRLPALSRKRKLGHSRQALLEMLKKEGPTDSEALASRLGISAMAVRQHLWALLRQKFVTFAEQPRPMGRPAKLWSLTRAADPLFPDAHAGLTVSLLNATQEAFGNEGLDKVVAECAARQIEHYQQQIPVRASLERRLEALMSIRNEEGYMAQVQKHRDGSFLLIENHCPICAAASACDKLCEAELQVFRAVLGPHVAIERSEHMIAGGRRCAYRIRPIRRTND